MCSSQAGLVIVEFHPVLWSLGDDLRLSGDDYFATTPFSSPVTDYVDESGLGLLHGAPPSESSTEPFVNPHRAHGYQHTLGQVVTDVVASGLRLMRLDEWPYSNGWRAHPALGLENRRWVWPPATARVPLMFGLVAERPVE